MRADRAEKTALVAAAGRAMLASLAVLLLTDALYFGGTSPETMRRLFPPPAYELPNDVFFEVTGVLQLFLGYVAGLRLYRLLVARRRVRGTSMTAETP